MSRYSFAIELGQPLEALRLGDPVTAEVIAARARPIPAISRIASRALP